MRKKLWSLRRLRGDEGEIGEEVKAQSAREERVGEQTAGELTWDVQLGRRLLRLEGGKERDSDEYTAKVGAYNREREHDLKLMPRRSISGRPSKRMTKK